MPSLPLPDPLPLAQRLFARSCYEMGATFAKMAIMRAMSGDHPDVALQIGQINVADHLTQEEKDGIAKAMRETDAL